MPVGYWDPSNKASGSDIPSPAGSDIFSMALSCVGLPEMRFIACTSAYSASVVVRVAIVRKAVRQGRGAHYGKWGEEKVDMALRSFKLLFTGH